MVRRVVAKVEFHCGEFFPRLGFIVTSLAASSRAVVRFYNKRGTAEQWIKESKQAVAISPGEPAEVEPARDGTTYATVGTAGTPRYAWTGAHETDRNFAAGKGSGTTVVGDASTQVGPYVNERDFGTTFETVDWSQARYADYGFIALDVTPAARGRRTTMTLRFIN